MRKDKFHDMCDLLFEFINEINVEIERSKSKISCNCYQPKMLKDIFGKVFEDIERSYHQRSCDGGEE